jgi:hypothetical protein
MDAVIASKDVFLVEFEPRTEFKKNRFSPNFEDAAIKVKLSTQSL